MMNDEWNLSLTSLSAAVEKRVRYLDRHGSECSIGDLCGTVSSSLISLNLKCTPKRKKNVLKKITIRDNSKYFLEFLNEKKIVILLFFYSLQKTDQFFTLRTLSSKVSTSYCLFRGALSSKATSNKYLVRCRLSSSYRSMRYTPWSTSTWTWIPWRTRRTVRWSGKQKFWLD